MEFLRCVRGSTVSSNFGNSITVNKYLGKMMFLQVFHSNTVACFCWPSSVPNAFCRYTNQALCRSVRTGQCCAFYLKFSLHNVWTTRSTTILWAARITYVTGWAFYVWIMQLHVQYTTYMYVVGYIAAIIYILRNMISRQWETDEWTIEDYYILWSYLKNVTSWFSCLMWSIVLVFTCIKTSILINVSKSILSMYGSKTQGRQVFITLDIILKFNNLSWVCCLEQNLHTRWP